MSFTENQWYGRLTGVLKYRSKSFMQINNSAEHYVWNECVVKVNCKLESDTEESGEWLMWFYT